MVNVNKNIVPGKKAESSAKTKPQVPARRPRNQELNSSRKPIDVRRASKGRQPFGTNLNSSKKLNCSLADSQLSLEALTEILQNLFPGYSNEESKQMMRERYNTAKQNYPEYDEPTLLKQMLWDYFGLTEDALSEISDVTDVETMKRLSDDANLWSDDPNFVDNYGEAMNSSACSDNTADESLNSSEITEDDFEYDEDGSGISTKDYMGYTIYKSIPDEDSGSVGYMVYDGDYPQSFDTLEECKEFIRDTLNSSKALNCSSEEPEGDADGGESVAEGVDASDIKITTESGNEVSMQDIKIVQNPDTNELAIFIPEDEEETIPEGFTVIGMVVPDAVGSTPAIEGGDVCPECGQDPCVCEGAEEEGEELDSSKKKNELTEDSVDSSLGGGDDRQDATSQVTVPKSFPDDKVHDLYRWVESELQNEGIDVDVFGVGRPSAGVVSFNFEVTGKDPAEVDAIIEDRVNEFIANGNSAIQYSEGDPRNGLNSNKQKKNLNCAVENARVEQTDQGTWVVRADTDRFGKDAILYEHYSEEGANKYLDRLKEGGDAVANGYDGHIDPKKVDLDSSDGTAEAKLDKASISKAMAKVLLEDKDTPLVYVKLKDGVQAYIQPAGYEDNQLVADGNFDEAKVYVAMYDKNYKPIMVNDREDNKMSGAEVVDYIKRNLGM